MELQDRKCVMILNEELPAGVLANTAGILGITLGKKVPENIGPDIYDKDGREHLGIVALPVPVLKADKEKLKAIRERLYQPEFAECVVVEMCIRDRDDTLGRIGGDEFVAFVRGVDYAGAMERAERLSLALCRTHISGSISWKLSASIGVVLSPGNATDAETLFKNADTALYQTKNCLLYTSTVYFGWHIKLHIPFLSFLVRSC